MARDLLLLYLRFGHSESVSTICNRIRICLKIRKEQKFALIVKVFVCLRLPIVLMNFVIYEMFIVTFLLDMLRNLLQKFSFQTSFKNIFLLSLNIIVVFVIGTFLTLFCRKILLPEEVYAEYPLNFVFRTCDKFGLCSYPESNVYLVKPDGDLLLESGVSYGVTVDFLLPDSTVNRESGMFLLVLKLENNEKRVYKLFQKSAVISYRSEIVRLIRTLFMLPFFIFDWSRETVFLSVNFFDDLVIGPHDSVVSLNVELQHTSLQILQSNLKITANLKGVRYFLYYWPSVSTAILFTIVISCLFCLSMFYWLLKSMALLFGKLNEDSLDVDEETKEHTRNGELKNKMASSSSKNQTTINTDRVKENCLFNGYGNNHHESSNGDMFVKKRR